ncbi:hypothetical protein ACIGO6_36750 [Streptomyces sp. NPDC053750]|uniref:hypothetical protein n=1 Tax=Streptomyces sp. NPDC053750 TaxID=3365714 RepID=UPI0037D32F5E
MTSPHPRRRPQRCSDFPRGPREAAGLQQIRDALPPAPDSRTVAPAPPRPAPRPAGDGVLGA